MRPVTRAGLLAGTYLVLTFPIAAVWHLMLFPEVYAGAAVRREPLMALGFLSTVVQAIVVAILYPLVQRGRPPLAEGVRFGLLMGCFLGSYGALAEAGKFEIGAVGPWIGYEGAFFLLQWLVIGTAVALVYRRTAP